jgi:hypothetical protein
MGAGVEVEDTSYRWAPPVREKKYKREKRRGEGCCGLAGLVCLGWFGPAQLAAKPLFCNSFLFISVFSTTFLKI